MKSLLSLLPAFVVLLGTSSKDCQVPSPSPSSPPSTFTSPTPCPESSPCICPSPSPSPLPTPSPTPIPPYPDSCPTMVCWKPQQTLFGPSDLKVGHKITIDSTEFFGVCLPRGRCNAEVNVVCGGRPCEDPRGVRWYQKSGPSIPANNWRVQSNESGDGSNDYGYQLQVKLPATGKYTICVSILPDLKDALGKSVKFASDAGRCTTFEVK